MPLFSSLAVFLSTPISFIAALAKNGFFLPPPYFLALALSQFFIS